MELEISKDIYETLLFQIPKPTEPTTTWSVSPYKLGVCIIEFRSHEYLKKVLHNMCNIYGGTDVVLYIVHGFNNEQFVKDIVSDWKNVRFVKLPYENIDIEKYNCIWTSSSFYENFETEFILLFQSDTVIRKRIPEEFFKYSYVGAPWTGYPNDWPDNPHVKLGNKLVGNGGFSLRYVSRMKDICNTHERKNLKLNEDVFITNHLTETELPSVDIAKQFSVEWIYYQDPVGLHQAWRFHAPQHFKKWFDGLI
jgi:hypothetical protein